jgi:hypothetical protein
MNYFWYEEDGWRWGDPDDLEGPFAILGPFDTFEECVNDFLKGGTE